MSTRANMKINKISSKLIKPNTPTPQNLKNYKISIIDHLAGPLNFAVVLFYESKPENNHLQKSLAKILVEFYPLAGRYIKNDHLVDCSDEGAEFIEAEALDVELIDLVAKIETDQLNALLPEPYFRVDEAADNPLLSIQATSFPSGGAAIAVSVSHRVFDASSLGTFVTAWSNAANQDHQTVEIIPAFNIPSLLPYKDLDHGIGSDQIVSAGDDEIVVKRFLFSERALTSLKSKIRASSGGKTVSGVRVVCAVIAKALICLDRAKHGRDRDFVIIQGINMRERTIPSQSKHSCGNLLITSLTPRISASEADEIGIQELVRFIGDSIRKSVAACAEILSPISDGRDIVIANFENFRREIWNSQTNLLVFTDWSKFGFYEADFGSGKPVWTSIGPVMSLFTSTTVLMSNKEGDGIEAWVHLNQNHMRCFEQNEEIKLFTT